MRQFDVIVLGLGHAGIEAALAAARMGCRVAGVTLSVERAGLMSCNPAIGGPGKSQLVAEIDALGGAMAQAADASGTQFRILNRSKGPALRATRVLVDRLGYARAVQRRVRAQPGLTVLEGEASGLMVREGRIEGVGLTDGRVLEAAAVVITAGTFLAARMHVGQRVEAGGRAGDGSAEGLPEALRALGLELSRFKTGTPPRLEGQSIDYRACVAQLSEADAGPLSAVTDRSRHPTLRQMACYLTNTTAATHAVVREALPLSPLRTGAIGARGPRYCPSLEHKVVGYPARENHPVYLEPEDEHGRVVYPAGLSTSLPEEAQWDLLRTIPGLERARLLRAGYAVEYDYVPATQLDGALQARVCSGLFLAGQINGSSGYEEAAGQGLVAGLNAALHSQGRRAWIPAREESFLGVLCDDLTRRGFDEPYRVLPARAEARLHLREDNAAVRLWRIGRDLGVLEEGRWRASEDLEVRIRGVQDRLTREQIRWIRQPATTLPEFLESERVGAGARSREAEALGAAFLELRYAPYQRQQAVAGRRLRELANLPIPGDLAFDGLIGLSREALAALQRARPRTLAEAQALPGMTNSAAAVLAAHLRRRSAPLALD
ncbi:MAG TPA: tRNA uridine-5-carboxymethylaminomethyl(34) synthesis enzyme MnmG [Myxococcales bacterium]|nr:tRNA uridine-5-carboxymethylaminomethyl(34) synthesis enzyme MnmG [Myxococcales bacterium]